MHKQIKWVKCSVASHDLFCMLDVEYIWSITPVTISLQYWQHFFGFLLNKECIKKKKSVLKAINGVAPPYMSDFLNMLYNDVFKYMIKNIKK